MSPRVLRPVGIKQAMAKNDLQGALDLLTLKTLSQLGSMHGYGIVMHHAEVIT